MGSSSSRATQEFQGSHRPLSPTRMSVRDTVTLSPWEKWKKHGRFPWKIIVHISLLVVVTGQLISYNSQDANYFRGARRNWYYFFFPESYDFSSRTHYLYTVDETVDAVQHAMNAYSNITEYAIDYLNYTYTDEEVTRPCLSCGLLKVQMYSDDALSWDSEDTPDFSLLVEEHWVNATYLGPLDVKQLGYENVSRYIRLTRKFSLSMRLVSYNIASERRICIVWSINLGFDFLSRGQISLTMDSEVLKNCDTTISLEDIWTRSLWLNFIIIFLAAVHLVLNVRSLLRSLYIYSRARRVHHQLRHRESERLNEDLMMSRRVRMMEREQHLAEHRSRQRQGEQGDGLERQGGEGFQPEGNHEQQQPMGRGRTEDVEQEGRQEDLPGGIPDYNRTAQLFMRMSWSDKLKFFNIWFVSTTVASVCLIAHGLYNLVHNTAHVPTALTHKLLAGLGCGLLWATLVAYLAHNKGYYTVVLTLNRAIPRVFRFMVGVVPILLGYAVFGMLYFGDYTDRFGDFQLSMISLFSVLNGDVIRETYMDLLPFAPVVTQVYLYTFISLFIYVVLNVFIAIVEESFFSTRSDPRSLEEYARVMEETGGDGPIEYTPIAPTSPNENGVDISETASPHVRRPSANRMDWFHRVLEEMDADHRANEGVS